MQLHTPTLMVAFAAYLFFQLLFLAGFHFFSGRSKGSFFYTLGTALLFVGMLSARIAQFWGNSWVRFAANGFFLFGLFLLWIAYLYLLERPMSRDIFWGSVSFLGLILALLGLFEIYPDMLVRILLFHLAVGFICFGVISSLWPKLRTSLYLSSFIAISIYSIYFLFVLVNVSLSLLGLFSGWDVQMFFRVTMMVHMLMNFLFHIGFILLASQKLYASLKKATRFSESIIEHMPLGVGVTDPNGHVQFTNPLFKEYFSLFSGKGSMHSLLPLFLREPSVADHVEEALGGAVSRGELATTPREDLRIPRSFEYTCFSVPHVESQLPAVVHLLEDITERKKEKELLVQAKAKAEEMDRSKTMFLANMSHELRTPLNAILGFTELLKEDFEDQEDTYEVLSRIHKSGGYLLELINDVLDLAKIDVGKMDCFFTPIRLRSFVLSMVENFSLEAEKKHLSLETFLDPMLPEVVMADERKLQQVLLNLLSNAIKFTEHGGILCAVRYQGGLREFHESVPICFEVRDTGVGISPQEQELLFENFVQTQSGLNSQKGTGLGLALSHKLVHLMGGELRVESGLDKGTSFFFCLSMDVAEEEVARVARQALSDIAGPRSDVKFLVVDDDEESLAYLGRLLGKYKLQYHTASDGLEALRLSRHWKPDLVWMDMRMPRLNGFDALVKIKEETPQTRVVMMSASLNLSEQLLLREAGADGVLLKPFAPWMVYSLIEKFTPLSLVYGSKNAVASDEMFPL
ncbi:MAG: response regulator [Myxococcales bacterium]|nr:response regulator [Myxococcales bacterium]